MRGLKMLCAAAAVAFSMAGAAQASPITFNLTLQDIIPFGVSGTGTLTFAGPTVLSNHIYTPGAAVTLLDFVIGGQDFNETNSFLSILTNNSGLVIAINTATAVPGILLTGPLGFTYAGNGQFGTGFINIVAAPSATPLPGALPLFASGLGAAGLLFGRRRKKQNLNLAAA